MKLENFFSNPPALAKYLFILLAAMLDILAILSFMRVNGGDLNHTIMYATYALMMFIDAALMLICGFRIGYKNKQVYQFAVVILVLNIVLTIFDQIGIVDIVFILLNALTLYVLLKYRKDFTEDAPVG